MPTEIKAWRCIYCPGVKAYVHKHSAVRHERHCFFNPVHKSCGTCKHFIPATGRDDDFEDRACGINAHNIEADNGDPYSGREGTQRDCSGWSPRPAIARATGAVNAVSIASAKAGEVGG